MSYTSLQKLRKEISKDHSRLRERMREQRQTLNDIFPLVFNTPLAKYCASTQPQNFRADYSSVFTGWIYIYTASFDLEEVLEHFCRPIYKQFKESWLNNTKGLRWEIKASSETELSIKGEFTHHGQFYSLRIMINLKDLETVCKIQPKTTKLRSYDEALEAAQEEAVRRNTVTTYEIDCGGLEE